MISLSLDHASLSFGSAVTGSRPARLSEHVSVFDNHAAGYSLSVHRSAFSPADLPLAVSATALTGGHLGSLLGSGPSRFRSRPRPTSCSGRPPPRRRRPATSGGSAWGPFGASGGRTGPLHRDGDVHGRRPVIAAVVAADACRRRLPQRLARRAGARGTVSVLNSGRSRSSWTRAWWSTGSTAAGIPFSVLPPGGGQGRATASGSSRTGMRS